MGAAPQGALDESAPDPALGAAGRTRRTLVKWAIVLAPALVVALVPAPAGITPPAWRLFAVFLSTIAGLIVQPAPGGAVVLLGITALVFTGAMSVEQVLGGYGDPVVWIALPAFFIARGMLKTGLGRRIAFQFIRVMGHRSLGLGYALVATDLLLATVVPSNSARAGGIIFPIGKSMAEAYDSRPGPSSSRLGAFLIPFLYQCDVLVCAMLVTGQSGNFLIARFAKQTANIDLTYAHWALLALVPGLAALAIVPTVLYLVFPPEVTRTPDAPALAATELRALGPMTRPEKLMLLVFALVVGLWMTSALHGIHYSVVGLLGVGVLLVTGVLDWEDVLAERAAWDVFVWYGGLLTMAGGLADSGVTKRFAEAAAGFTTGWVWWAALIGLLVVYFYAHYAFASISAHATAMYIPFLVVIIAAGAPPLVAAIALASFSNLCASLTHYGTTPAPIFFGSGYVSQGTWWRLGLIVSIPSILVWLVFGLVWWKALGLW